MTLVRCPNFLLPLVVLVLAVAMVETACGVSGCIGSKQARGWSAGAARHTWISARGGFCGGARREACARGGARLPDVDVALCERYLAAQRQQNKTVPRVLVCGTHPILLQNWSITSRWLREALASLSDKTNGVLYSATRSR